MTMVKDDVVPSSFDAKEQVRRLRKVGVEKGLWRRGDKFVSYCRGQLFRGIELRNKTVLDVGCGDGLYLIWAGVQGARRMVGLEPLLHGSGATKNSDVIFFGVSEALGLDNIERLPYTLQDYPCDDATFDVVLTHASINHLDEDLCIELRDNPEARRVYVDMFKKLRRIMKPGGQLIAVDASNRNFFGDLGLKHPLYSKLAFYKHQTPEFWAELLTQAGFTNPQISWISNPMLGPFGFFLRNRVAAYFLESSFRLVMTAE